MSSYDIIPYQPEFKPQVLELQTELWSPNLELNRAYFDWKHESNPYFSPSRLFLALHQGRVVGMRSFFGVQWEAGYPHQLLTSLYADDLVITEEHRNHGLVSQIMSKAFHDLADSGHEYVFNLSAGLVTFMSSLSMGWRNAGFMQPMRRRPWRVACDMAVNRIAKNFPAAAVETHFSGGFHSLDEISPDFLADRIEEPISFSLTPPIDAMAALVRHVGSDGRIRHVRDRTYYSWRFRNPFRRYGFLLYGEDTLEGYLVLQEHTSGANLGILSIVDWEASRPHVLSQLLKAACMTGGDRRLLTVWSSTLSPDQVEILSQNGFRIVEEKQNFGARQYPLLVRALTPGRPLSDWTFAGRPLLNLCEWDVRMLYSMHG